MRRRILEESVIRALESFIRSIGGYGSEERRVIFPAKPRVRRVSAQPRPDAPPPTMTTCGKGVNSEVANLDGARRDFFTSSTSADLRRGTQVVNFNRNVVSFNGGFKAREGIPCGSFFNVSRLDLETGTYMSTTFISRHAPCHGQTSRPLSVNTPFFKGAP